MCRPLTRPRADLPPGSLRRRKASEAASRVTCTTISASGSYRAPRSSRWRAARIPTRGLLARSATARAAVQDIPGSIHNLAHQLHPARLKLLGLVPTLKALCREIADQHSLQVTFRTSGLDHGVPDELAVCVFRVAQEALQNAVKHSGADTLDVDVSGADGQLTLRVADDGTGFSPGLLPAAGLGLHTMRERVESIGGRLTIEPAGRRG